MIFHKKLFPGFFTISKFFYIVIATENKFL